jgi:hypothetical protein
MRINTSSLIPNQLPDFVRADYPTFIAFVEAYYEYLDNQGVDLKSLRDLDTTIDSFIQYFKRELAINLPSEITVDERFLLHHIKDQYLAKGSEGSFKLLFRLLYNKNVTVNYPGRQMLRASDGRWQQDISIFVNVTLGDPADIDGKLVDVIKPNRTFKLLIDRRQYVEVEIARVVQLSDNTFEFFIDRKYFGEIEVGDEIRYKELFVGKIVSTTSNLQIIQAGEGFTPGQLFELKTGAGVRSIVKITRVGADGEILSAEFIKFGIGYATDFSLSINATNDYYTSTNEALLTNTLITSGSGKVAITPLTAGSGYTTAPTITIQAPLSGTTATATCTLSSGTVKSYTMVNSGSGYTDDPTITIGTQWTSTTVVTLGTQLFFSNRLYTVTTAGTTSGTAPTHTSGAVSNGTATLTYAGVPATASASSIEANIAIQEVSRGFDEQGYINNVNYAYDIISGVFSPPWDGAYAGSVIREFTTQASQGVAVSTLQDAILKISLGSLAKYPGYYSTNDGFLSDAIFIQDSRYYQAFSYVLKLDERLDSYKTAVKTMVHPAGTALFGEFEVQNNFDISVELESLVKSLSLRRFDTIFLNEVVESIILTASKLITEDEEVFVLQTLTQIVDKVLTDSVEPLDSEIRFTSKPLTSILDTPTDTSWIHSTGKSLTTTLNTPTDSAIKEISKALSDSSISTDIMVRTTTKYLEDGTDFENKDDGYLAKDPYSEGGYFSINPIIYDNTVEETFGSTVSTNPYI